jgi:hypothetical protein
MKEGDKPSRKWLPKRRVKVERWRMRPVPVVRLLKALVDQLSEKREEIQQRRSTRRKRKSTFSESGSRVATRRAGSLLDVVRDAPTATARSVGLVVSLTKTLGTFGLEEEKESIEKWEALGRFQEKEKQTIVREEGERKEVTSARTN